MTYGTYQRTAPRINILSGWWGNEPFGRKRSAPVTANVAIQSGQVISLTAGAWVLGCAAGKEPFIAFHDSTDTDVVSRGLLLGLSCAGQYEIQTAWFDNTQVYVESSPLIAATGGSSAALTVANSAALGAITLGTFGTAEDTIGYATNGGRQVLAGYKDATNILANPINSESGPTNTAAAGAGSLPSASSGVYVLQFRTTWLPRATTSS